MNVHKNARLTPHGRERIIRQVESGQTPKAVGEAAGVCPRTVRKWVSRYRSEGLGGLRDRSSRPHRLHRPTPLAVIAEVERLRRQRYTGQEIAAGLRISPATVSRILRRLGLNRLTALEPAEPVRRYEREHPGELIHIDIKKLGRFNHVGHRITGDRRGQSNSRGVGWEYVHVCIDDASRIAYAEIKKSERKVSAIAFLKAAVIYYAKLGISIQRVMTDNGSCYKSRAFGRACKRLGLKHIRTRPYTPKTNGKAERFIQTALREWAYAKAYQRSDHRGAELPLWLHRYNWHRPHGSIGAKPPISRLGLTRNNHLVSGSTPTRAANLRRLTRVTSSLMVHQAPLRRGFFCGCEIRQCVLEDPGHGEPREVRSCLIDREVVCCDERWLAAFDLLRRRRNEARAFLYGFDLLELNGTDMRRARPHCSRPDRPRVRRVRRARRWRRSPPGAGSSPRGCRSAGSGLHPYPVSVRRLPKM